MTRLIACLIFLAVLALPARAEGPVGLNLAPVTDWSSQAPFIDVMKTARPWIVHRAGQWGGAGEAELVAAGLLDNHGWPIRQPRELGTVGTLILTDIPEEATALAGTYRLAFHGKGIVEVSGRATNVRYADGDVIFDYTPGPGPVEIRIQRSDPEDYVRNITVIREDHRAAYDAGAVFTPEFLDQVKGFTLFRFMDWMATNNSQVQRWTDRPLPPDYTYARNGVPLEILLLLMRETGADGWFTLPHMADDDFIRRFGQLLKSGAPDGANVYAEYSNEVWNWQFAQTAWADEQAQSRWEQPETGPQFYGMRAAQMADILRQEFDEGTQEGAARLVTVLSSQTGWLGLEGLIFEAPLWQAEPDGPGNPPWVYFDAYAVTAYFGGIIGTEDRAPQTRAWIDESLAAAQATAVASGLTGEARAAHIAKHRYDRASELAGADLIDGAHSGDPLDTVSDLLTRVLPYHRQVAQAHGLDLLIYEGGSHVVGIGPMTEDEALTEFFTHFNYTPQMGALYERLLTGWQEAGGGPFVAYSDIYVPSRWGSWGALRWLGDDTPRWRALRAALSSGEQDE